jgi:RNA polymerase sigma-70 factor (ECF subfamily)
MYYNKGTMETRELLKKCVKKDKKAWDIFIKRYGYIVEKSVRYKLKALNIRSSREEYRDIVQEVFLIIWDKNRLLAVKNAETLKGWLAIVSINITSNYCRKEIFKKAENTLSLDEDLSPAGTGCTLHSVIMDKKSDVFRETESEEFRGLIEREISKLEYRQQLAIKFQLYDGKTQRDISEIMNIPEGTAATLLKRAKSRLRKRLEALSIKNEKS